MAHVLFVCLHNAGRSQMSQAIFERAACDEHTATSAGTTPAARVHPEVIDAMREIDIDLTGRTPQKLTVELAQDADIVVTMGCGDKCPYIPGKRYIDWELPDPKGQPLEAVRETRDEIARRVAALITDLRVKASSNGETMTGGPRLAPLAQLERLVELGYSAACGLSEPEFREWLSPLVSADAEDFYDPATGRVSALLVIRQGRVPAEFAMRQVVVRGKEGYVDMNPTTPETFAEIDSVTTPDADAYLVHDFNPGDEFRDLPPSEAMPRILKAGRSPVTIDEALAAAVLHAALVADKHAFSILASRSQAPRVTESVPAIWISRGAPRLGWCWNNNPHSWLGSASCGARSAPARS